LTSEFFIIRGGLLKIAKGREFKGCPAINFSTQVSVLPNLHLNFFTPLTFFLLDEKYTFVRGSAEFWLGRELAHDFATSPQRGIAALRCLGVNLTPDYYSGLFAHEQTACWPGYEPALQQMARSSRCPSPLGGYSIIRAKKR
jgi:hypothetical protein